MRIAAYTRRSSDLQNESSTVDQLAAIKRKFVGRTDVQIIHFTDEGISGSAIANRPGIRAMMAAAERGEIDLVVTEALDRLSRDQEGSAHLFKRLTYYGVGLETLSEGKISELHVGLSGTMNQLFLVELGRKTRRGLIGRVKAGFSGGGLCFGYRIADKGVLEIDDHQAGIIRRIYKAYSEGVSPRG